MTVAFVMFPANPLTEISDGYGVAAPVPSRLIVPGVVPTRMFQPPAILPTLLPESSTIKSFHTPFATLPLKEDNFRPADPPAGAGEGNVSPGSKSVGR